MRVTLSRRSILASIGLVGFGMLASPGSWHAPHRECPTLEAQLTALAPQELEHLKVFLRHMSIVQLNTGVRTALATQEGGQAVPATPTEGTATTIRFSGVNVQIVNGLNATNGFPSNRSSVNPAETVVNGLGNLIVGYNEGADNLARRGSHNIIVGARHQYSSFGGLVVGDTNTISGAYSSVSGGIMNKARGAYSSVSGGSLSTASGDHSSVSGGALQSARGDYSSVSGGANNIATGRQSAISGGNENRAFAADSSVTGGVLNVASASGSTVCGGSGNTASGDGSTVCGGVLNQASGRLASVSGGSNNQAIGDASSVSGGGGVSVEDGNQALGDYSSISGGSRNTVTAAGSQGTVSGGCNVTVNTSCGHQ